MMLTETGLFYRHFMGEDLESLNIKELQHLEQQLEVGLKQVITRKVRSLVHPLQLKTNASVGFDQIS